MDNIKVSAYADNFTASTVFCFDHESCQWKPGNVYISGDASEAEALDALFAQLDLEIERILEDREWGL